MRASRDSVADRARARRAAAFTARAGHAARREAAFQQELLLSLALLPAAALLPVSTLERLLLVLSTLFVLCVELLNSAVEATVDRISAERHPLAGQAKDMASAAVLIALAMSALCWAVIALPVAWACLGAALAARS